MEQEKNVIFGFLCKSRWVDKKEKKKSEEGKKFLKEKKTVITQIKKGPYAENFKFQLFKEFSSRDIYAPNTCHSTNGSCTKNYLQILYRPHLISSQCRGGVILPIKRFISNLSKEREEMREH